MASNFSGLILPSSLLPPSLPPSLPFFLPFLFPSFLSFSHPPFLPSFPRLLPSFFPSLLPTLFSPFLSSYLHSLHSLPSSLTSFIVSIPPFLTSFLRISFPFLLLPSLPLHPPFHCLSAITFGHGYINIPAACSSFLPLGPSTGGDSPPKVDSIGSDECR